MRKPGVLERITPAGRLRASLLSILERVESREIPRMEAGDRILSEIIQGVGVPRSPAERHLLREAQLWRAQLYQESGGATPLEAAEALEAAFQQHQDLPSDAEASQEIVTLSMKVLCDLAKIGSRRTRFRTLSILVQAWVQTGCRDIEAATFMREIPQAIRDLMEAGEDPGVSLLLETLAHHRHVPALQAVLETSGEAALGLATRAGNASACLNLCEMNLGDLRELRRQVGVLLADQNRTDQRSLRFLEEILEQDPESRSSLELSLRRLAHVGPRGREDLTASERLNRILRRFFDHQEWVYRNLAVIDALRGDEEGAVAAFAAAHDRGSRGEDAVGVIASSLASLGFHRAAQTLIQEAGSALSEARVRELVQALAAGSRALEGPVDAATADALVKELGDIVMGGKSPAGVASRLHRVRGHLSRRGGDKKRAALLMERALSLRESDHELAAELTESLLAIDEHERAEVFLQVAHAAGDTPHALELRATVLRRRGDAREALECVQKALAGPHVANAVALVRRLRDRYRRLSGASASPFLDRLAQENTAPWETRDREGHLRIAGAELARELGDATQEVRMLEPLVERPGIRARYLVSGVRAALRSRDLALADRWLGRARRRQSPPAQVEELTLARALLAKDAVPSARSPRGSSAAHRVLAAWEACRANDPDRVLEVLEGTGAALPQRLSALGAELQAWALTTLGQEDRALEVLERQKAYLSIEGGRRLARLLARRGLRRRDRATLEAALSAWGLGPLDGHDRWLRELTKVQCGLDIDPLVLHEVLKCSDPDPALMALREGIAREHLKAQDLPKACRFLRGLHETPEIRGILFLERGAADPSVPAPSALELSACSRGLRLAVVRVLLERRQDADTVQPYLTGLEGADADLLRSFLTQGGSWQSVGALSEAATPGAFSPTVIRLVGAVQGRGGGGPEGASGSHEGRFEAWARLHRLGEIRDPRRLSEELMEIRALLPEDSAAFPLVRRALSRLGTLRSEVSLATFSELVHGHPPPDLEDVISQAERLLELNDSPVVYHHHCLAVHEFAFALADRAGSLAYGTFEKAHALWARFLDHPNACEHLAPAGLEPEALAAALRALRGQITRVHTSHAARWVDQDRHRATEHATLALRSPLSALERDQVRCDLYVGLTGGLDPEDGGPQRALLRRRLEFLLEVDPENRPGMGLLLALSAKAIRRVLKTCPPDAEGCDFSAGTLEALEEHVAAATSTVRPLEDEAALYGATDLELNSHLGLWYLGSSVISRFSEGDSPRAREMGQRARWWFETLGDSGPRHSRWGDLLAYLEAPDSPPEVPVVAVVDGTPVTGVSASDMPEEVPQEEDSTCVKPVWDEQQVRSLLDQGFVSEAETLLDTQYRAAAERADRAAMREVIDLLQEVHTHRAEERERIRQRAALEELGSRRFRQALDLLGGRVLDPTLSLELICARVRALLGLRQAGEALREAEIARRRAVIDGHTPPELWSLHEQAVVETMGAQLGQDLSPPWNLLLEGKAQDALRMVSELLARHPKEPVLAWVRARALGLAGLPDDARVAIDEVRKLLDGRDDCETLKQVVREWRCR